MTQQNSTTKPQTLTARAVMAANRFAYGARPGDIEYATSDPQQWLIKQLTNLTFDDDLPNSSRVLSEMHGAKKQMQQNKRAGKARDKSGRRKYQKIIRQLSTQGIRQAITSNNSLSWRLLDFFSNHFSVSGSNALLRGLAPTLEREAIAPNLMGDFAQMLVSVVSHPAMILYLNNERSLGPNSVLARRNRKKKQRGLNENMAREILELHTLGVNAGYSQSDVTEFSKALTGWSVKRPRENGEGFVFRSLGHEPGPVKVLSKTYQRDGFNKAVEILTDLARNQHTARHICTKLVKHFIADKPNPKLVSKLVDVWLKSGANIKQVMSALIQSQASWQISSQKFKTPREFLISVNRALARDNITDHEIYSLLTALGQAPFNAGSPAGYSDDQVAWDSATSLLKKIDWLMMFTAAIRQDVRATIKTVFDGELSELTYQSVTRAESRQLAYSLLFMSPEFLRR